MAAQAQSPLTGAELLAYVKKAPKSSSIEDVIRGAGYVSTRKGKDGQPQEMLNKLDYFTELTKAQGMEFQGMERGRSARRSTGRLRIGNNGTLPLSSAYTRMLQDIAPGGYVKVEYDSEENCLVIYPHEDQSQPEPTESKAPATAEPQKKLVAA